jgi:large subunit ribosomal protein L21e
MPFKAYHGKTGRVYNISKHALGVIVNKRVRGHILPKRINVRLEHVKPSRCREDFLRRVVENDVKRRTAAAKKVRVCLKRFPALPRPAQVITNPPTPIFLAPIPYEFVA